MGNKPKFNQRVKVTFEGGEVRIIPFTNERTMKLMIVKFEMHKTMLNHALGKTKEIQLLK